MNDNDFEGQEDVPCVSQEKGDAIPWCCGLHKQRRTHLDGRVRQHGSRGGFQAVASYDSVIYAFIVPELRPSSPASVGFNGFD